MSDPKIKITNRSFDHSEDGIKIHNPNQNDSGKKVNLFLQKPYKLVVGIVLGLLIIGGIIAYSIKKEAKTDHDPEVVTISESSKKEYQKQKVLDPEANFYGFDLSNFKDPEYLSYQPGAPSPRDMITAQGLSSDQLNEILALVPDMELLRKPPMGSRIALLTQKGDLRASYFIYEPSRDKYWVFGIKDSLYFEEVKRTSKTGDESLHTMIENSLKSTIERKRLMADSIGLLLDSALAWTVDLYHLPENSKIKFVYQKNFIDDELISVGPLQAVQLETPEKEYYAFRFYHNKKWKYVDLDGNFLKNSFLKAPVNYSRISSRFGMRPHPIKNKTKFHYGTDYAAKAGSPIMAVADGEILVAKYREHNGYYVKIRHDGGYETLYLHMQKNSIPSKVRPGYRVKQGEVIGLVGATGDATGPHVCFHIRKNAKPIDPESVKLPSPEALKGDDRERFLLMKDSLMHKLAQITYTK